MTTEPRRIRPLPVTVFGSLFILAGLVGLVYHLFKRPLEPWLLPVSLVRVLAVLGGVFLLLGRGWARWLLLAWLAFHVVLSAFHSFSEFAAHAVLLLILGYFLFRTGPSSAYFRPS